MWPTQRSIIARLPMILAEITNVVVDNHGLELSPSRARTYRFRLYPLAESSPIMRPGATLRILCGKVRLSLIDALAVAATTRACLIEQ